MADRPRRTTLGSLIESMLPRCGPITLRNPFGVIELRGTDLYLRRGRTLSLYHREAQRGEARSHAHLYVSGLSWARVVERDGITPRLSFWPDAREEEEKAPLTIAFPRFYDWSRVPIPDNRAHFAAWVSKHGRTFILEPDPPVARSRRAAAGFPGSDQVGGPG
ncbi:MAG: hypothetical protein VX265_13985 [Myxococcota bacterium]|nr:hypothetical protein [Myxococcota bacterium]